MGKNFDQIEDFGPELVTPDELCAGAVGLRILWRLGGKIMQDGDTGDMILDITTLIATNLKAMMLKPGDVFGSCTPARVGYACTSSVFLRAGDQTETETDRVGTLTNMVAASSAA